MRFRTTSDESQALVNDIAAEARLADMMARQAARSHPDLRVTSPSGKVYRKGYGIGGQVFGFKYDGITEVWNRREAIYEALMGLVSKKDTIAVFEYLLAHVSRQIDLNLVAGYVRHLLALPLQFFELRRVGEILSRLRDAGYPLMFH